MIEIGEHLASTMTTIVVIIGIVLIVYFGCKEEK